MATADQIEIRRAATDEFAAVGRLTLDAYLEIGVGHGSYGTLLADAAGRAASARLLVATIGGALAGTVTLVAPGSPLREVAMPGEDELRMLAVSPAHQRQGVGAALVRACQGDDWRPPGRDLVASSAAAMTSAHRIYERLGFLRNPVRDWQPNPETELLVFEWRADRPPG